MVVCRGLPSCRRPERNEGSTRKPEALYHAYLMVTINFEYILILANLAGISKTTKLYAR